MLPASPVPIRCCHQRAHRPLDVNAATALISPGRVPRARAMNLPRALSTYSCIYCSGPATSTRYGINKCAHVGRTTRIFCVQLSRQNTMLT